MSSLTGGGDVGGDGIEGEGGAPPKSKAVVFATRIHLGNATSPPSQSDLDGRVASFLRWASSCGAMRAAVAVDPSPKIEGYDLVREVEGAVERVASPSAAEDGGASQVPVVPADVLPVSPWGKFVPALNALTSWAASHRSEYMMLASAETSVPPSSVEALLSHFDDGGRTLVVGAALPGHDYRGDGNDGGGNSVRVELTGRTVPWNTLAVWDVPKLALTGFPLVADGLHPLDDGSALGPSGVEERSAVALLQRVLPEGWALAKLVRVEGVRWDTDFGDDEGRREWHDRKMRSKEERAARHGELLGWGGWVVHC